MKKNSISPKKIVIDVYTQRCGWCKKMDATTFSEDMIAKYINENYYAIKFDAESKTPINFNGTTYNYIQTFNGGYHELAAVLLSGKLMYPTIVFLDEDNNLIQAIPGFQSVNDFEMIINYFAGDFHKSTPWKKFKKNYESRSPLTTPVGNKH
jgi:thioredoxin-related protein